MGTTWSVTSRKSKGTARRVSPRPPLPWSRSSMNWRRSWGWTPWSSGSKTRCRKVTGCRMGYGMRGLAAGKSRKPSWPIRTTMPLWKVPIVGGGPRWDFAGEGAERSSAPLSVNSNGTITLVRGWVDSGGTGTAVSMQAAEVLGLRPEDVIPTVVDTDTIGFTATTGGSRITFDTGLAAIKAAEEVKQQMRARAALLWDVAVEGIAVNYDI